jgi:DNA-binding NarL/FixJ family response regulator
MSRHPDAVLPPTRAGVDPYAGSGVATAAAEGSSTLVVVGPHPLVRWGLNRAVEGCRDLASVGEAASRDEALALCHMVQPDVVAIDLTLPDDSGWKLARQLRAARPDVGIVILADGHSDRTMFNALDVGASAFVRKDDPVPQVLAAIRGAALSPGSFHTADLAAALRRRRTTDERTALSPREREILFLLRDGLSVPAIAARLFVSLSTAKTYVARLYEKLGARNRAQALMAAVRDGLFDEGLHEYENAVG